MDTTLTLRIIHRKYEFAGLSFFALLAKKRILNNFAELLPPLLLLNIISTLQFFHRWSMIIIALIETQIFEKEIIGTLLF